MADALSKEATDCFIEVGGIRLHYNDVGAGPVLLSTHGGGPGASAWGTLARAVPFLAGDFRLLLLDLPNFGESEKGVTRGEEPADIFLAHLMGEFLDAVGVPGPVSLCSSSGGSPAVLRFALDFPARTHKLIIQAYAPGMTPNPESDGAQATRAFLEQPSRVAMTRLFELFIPNANRRHDDAVTHRFQAAMAPGHLESRAEFGTLTANSNLAGELHGLRSEVLIVWGAADGIVPVERALAALGSIPRSQAHIWGDGTGHLVPYEHPQEFAGVVRRFLHEPPGP